MNKKETLNKYDTIHITCGFDSKYTRFACVLLVSIFENNKDENICCHIMGLHLEDKDKQDVMYLAKKYNQDVIFYDMDEDKFKGFPVSKQWNYAVYFRLILPNLLDKSVNRIIYLDCDIVCRGPLRHLYDVDLKGNIIGACEDHVLSPRMSLCYLNKVDADNFYFNSGVLLIDCEAWRRNRITEKCLDYLRVEHPMHFDQDTLNSVLQRCWLHLPYRWNYMADFHGAYFHDKEYEMDLNKSYPFYPVLIHFTGVKPWNHANRSVYKYEFFKYQSLTRWKDIIPKHTFVERLMNICRRTCDKLGLKKMNPYQRYDFKF